MAKEKLTENENYEQDYTTRNSDILYRSHLEYTGKKIFWSAALGLGAITIYASLVYLVVQQLRK